MAEESGESIEEELIGSEIEASGLRN